MKIAADAIIPKEKLVQYLLLPRQKNDKSQWLARVGFTREQPGTLEKAIHQLITEKEAILDRNNEYGTFYTVQGQLHGPYGTLSVITVWLLPMNAHQYRFVTLKPARE